MLPLLIHGDAAFAGQGVVASASGCRSSRGHRSGGSIHFIVNNQIGFTTSPLWARSSPYPSDVAKMIEAPIFHVNGDDPEAVVFAAKIATEFRQKFQQAGGHRHVLLPPLRPQRGGRAVLHPAVHVQAHRRAPDGGRDLRQAADRRRRGQPRPRSSEMKAEYRKHLDDEFTAAEGYKANKADWLDGRWAHLKAATLDDDPRRGQTGVATERLKKIGLDGHRCRRPSSCTAPCSASSTAAARRSRRARASTGHRRGARLRHAAPGRFPGAAVGPGRAARHLLAAPRRADRSGDRASATRRSTTWARPGGEARGRSTRCCRKRRCSASNTATRSPSPTRW